mgnify:CR=1 FL=1
MARADMAVIEQNLDVLGVIANAAHNAKALASLREPHALPRLEFSTVGALNVGVWHRPAFQVVGGAGIGIQ